MCRKRQTETDAGEVRVRAREKKSFGEVGFLDSRVMSSRESRSCCRSASGEEFQGADVT